MKRMLLTAVLIGAMAAIPPQSRAKTYRPYNAAIMIGCGILVIGVGIVVIIQIKKLCDKIPAPDPPPTNNIPPPPWTTPTNNPSTNTFPPFTNPPAPKKPWYTIWSLDDENVTYTITNTGEAYSAWNLQTANSMRGPWTTLYAVQTWLDYTGTVTQWTDSKGVVVWVSHCDPGGSDNIPLDIGSGNEPQQFYRISQ